MIHWQVHFEPERHQCCLHTRFLIAPSDPSKITSSTTGENSTHLLFTNPFLSMWHVVLMVSELLISMKYCITEYHLLSWLNVCSRKIVQELDGIFISTCFIPALLNPMPFTDLGPKFIIVQSSIDLSTCKHTISYICIYMLYCECLTLVDGDCTCSSYRKLWSNNKSSIKYFKFCAYFLKTLHYSMLD